MTSLQYGAIRRHVCPGYTLEDNNIRENIQLIATGTTSMVLVTCVCFQCKLYNIYVHVSPVFMRHVMLHQRMNHKMFSYLQINHTFSDITSCSHYAISVKNMFHLENAFTSSALKLLVLIVLCSTSSIGPWCDRFGWTWFCHYGTDRYSGAAQTSAGILSLI